MRIASKAASAEKEDLIHLQVPCYVNAILLGNTAVLVDTSNRQVLLDELRVRHTTNSKETEA